MQQIRMGIIGIGVMGSRHAQSLFAGDVDHMILTAVCDIKSARLQWAEEQFGDRVTRFEKAEDLMDSGLVDAVLVAVPHYFHAQYVIYAFSKGLHVICEKPAGVYAKQVEEMNEAARRSGRVFCMMYNQRTNPYFRKLREMVQSGELGELRRMTWIVTNWYRSQSYYDSSDWRATWNGEGGGILINQCPHNLDLWQWICGMPARIRAFCQYGRYHTIEVEDSVTVYAEYENGMTAQLITTTGEPSGTNRLEVTADKGKVVIEEVSDNVFQFRYWKFAQSEREFNATYTGGFGEPAAEVTEFVPEYLFPYFDGHKKIIRNFVDAILNGAELIAPGEEGIKAVQIINAINYSAWTDGWAEIPVDEDGYLVLLNEKRASSAVKVAREINMDVTASKA
mgnify:CR=1 FL=1